MAELVDAGSNFPHTADVVIIGGGPAGTATLWALELMQPGIKSVLIEKASQLGSGSSIASMENFRSCWPALPLARQMERGIEVFRHADDYLGDGAQQAIHMRERGYLFCAFNEKQAAALNADVIRLNSIELNHVEYLEEHEVKLRFPWLDKTVVAVKYDPHAGHLDSNALIHRYAQSTQSARILLEVPDVSIRVSGGRVTGVQTMHGSIDSPNVLIAAGAHSRQIGRTAGVELPLIMRPRQSFTTAWRSKTIPDDAPTIISAPPAPHLRPEAREGAIICWTYAWNTKAIDSVYGPTHERDAIIEPLEPVSTLKDKRFPSITLALLARQFGHGPGEGFNDPRYARGIRHNIGYYVYRDETVAYAVQPDGSHRPYESERAIVDRHPDVPGLFVSIAHVGHGIMASPASGEIAASLILGRELPDPAFKDFGFAAHWVEYDENPL